MSLENRVPKFENPYDLMESNFDLQLPEQKSIFLYIDWEIGFIDLETRDENIEGIPPKAWKGLAWLLRLNPKVDATKVHDWVNSDLKPVLDPMCENFYIENEKPVFKTEELALKFNEIHDTYEYALDSLNSMQEIKVCGQPLTQPANHNFWFINLNRGDEDWFEPLAYDRIYPETTDDDIKKIAEEEYKTMKAEGYIPPNKESVVDALEKLRDRLANEKEEEDSLSPSQ